MSRRGGDRTADRFRQPAGKGVHDAVAEKGVLGAFTGGFEAGAAGICAAIFFGLLVAMCFKSKDKQ